MKMSRVAITATMFTVLVAWLVVIDSSAQAQNNEYSGAGCGTPTGGCLNNICITGVSAKNANCKASPGGNLCIVVFPSATTNAGAIQYKVCIDQGTKTDSCTSQPLGKGQNPVTCNNMNYWSCGCMNGDSTCGVNNCECSGTAAGLTNFTIGNTCT